MNETDARDLLEVLQNSYDRSCLAKSPKNFFPIVSEFAKELFISEPVRPYVVTIREGGKADLDANKDLQKKLFIDIDNLITELRFFKHISSDIEILLQKYEHLKRNNALNWELMLNINEEINVFLTSVNENSLLWLTKDYPIKQIAKFTEKYSQLWQHATLSITRRERTSLFYSLYFIEKVHKLYNLDNRQKHFEKLVQNNKPCTANNFYSDVKDFDIALELSSPQDAVPLGLDVEEYKVHMHRVLVFIKSKLLEKKGVANKQNSKDLSSMRFQYVFSNKDDLRQGVLVDYDTQEELKDTSGNAAELIYFLLKNGKTHRDDIEEKIFSFQKDDAENPVKNAKESANRRYKKYFPENLIISTGGFLDIKPIYRSRFVII